MQSVSAQKHAEMVSCLVGTNVMMATLKIETVATSSVRLRNAGHVMD